jgi:uncharacterized protein YigE (DUF2233 family)
VNRNKIFTLTAILALAIAATFVIAKNEQSIDGRFVSYTVDAKKQDIKFYWKNDKQENFRNILNLKTWLTEKNQELVFAMNGGMYKQDNSPQGLFIENGETVISLDTSTGKGNFYLKPNGVFYITANNVPIICRTENFNNDGQIRYATQSGPMLLIDGRMHPAFKDGSTNLNLRNGVGILPDGKVIFAMSKKEINFYDFASYFKALGCKNALYLDGLVSRTYLPEKNWTQTDGNFGVIIAVTKGLN